jgi:hypothetical protein
MLLARAACAVVVQGVVAAVFALQESPTPRHDAEPWLSVYGTSERRAAERQGAAITRRRAYMNDRHSTRTLGPSQTAPHIRARAETKITVQGTKAQPYDQSNSPALLEIRLSETFTGDLEGESAVRALQVRRDDQSATMVSIQRFRGRLGEREGTFALHGSESIERGRIKATWSVVPGSGTGALHGLRGEGGFEGQFGKGSDGTLEYWFE